MELFFTVIGVAVVVLVVAVVVLHNFGIIKITVDRDNK